MNGVYVVNGAVWVPSSGSTSSFVDIVNLSCNVTTGAMQNFAADGHLWVTFIWSEDLFIQGSFDTADPSQVLDQAKLEPGDAGTATVTFKHRPTGNTITATISNCVIGDLNASTPHSGTSSGSISFRAYSSDGTTSPFSASWS